MAMSTITIYGLTMSFSFDRSFQKNSHTNDANQRCNKIIHKQQGTDEESMNCVHHIKQNVKT